VPVEPGREPHQPDEPLEPAEASESRDLFGDEAPAARSRLPQFAAVGGVIVAIAAGVWFWQRGQGAATAAIDQPATPIESAAAQPPPADAAAGAPAVAPSPPAPEPSAPTPDVAPPQSGWVAVSAPFDVTITNAGQALTLDEMGRANLAAGKYRLRFQNTSVGYDETRAIEVRSTMTTPITLTPQTRLSVKSTDPAEVIIDGKRVGETPYQGRMPFGAHTITVKGSAGEREFPTEPTLKPVQLEVDFSKPEI